MTDLISKLLEELLQSAQVCLLKPRNVIYVRNRLYARFGLQPSCDAAASETQSLRQPIEIVEELLELLSDEQRRNLGANWECQCAAVINELLPLPDALEAEFAKQQAQVGIQAALNWYYQFNCASDYIKLTALHRNISWTYASYYGQLLITINLAKPEKDPRAIANHLQQAATGYPLCQLCPSNEGFAGSQQQSARATHRLLSVPLSEGQWYFQFSPYSYFSEHAIVFNAQHRPMQISLTTFNNFFAFVDWAPHYLIGANSDLPIVGGSILTHDHYQAGACYFPIEHAASHFSWQCQSAPEVTLDYLNWPLSTVRLTGPRQALTWLLPQIINAWYTYRNEELAIVPVGERGQRHNALTPIMRKLGADKYCVYLILRNNRVTLEHPLGLFHPHAEHHHLKKENIGLIEAMGLAILPGRLKDELSKLEQLLARGASVEELRRDPDLVKHQSWFLHLQQLVAQARPSNFVPFMQEQVGVKFVAILADCGVFKSDIAGIQAAHDFCAQF